MEQLNSMFVRMKRGMWPTGNTDQPTEKQQRSSFSQAENSDMDISDEEDGFVFIQQSQSKTSVASSYSTDENAEQRMQWNTTQNTSRGFSMFATCNVTPESHIASADTWNEALGTSDHSAIFDVPFQLNPKLQAKDNLQHMLAQLNLKTAKFDWQKYNYDFDVDRSSLHELCSMGPGSCTQAGLWER